MYWLRDKTLWRIRIPRYSDRSVLFSNTRGSTTLQHSTICVRLTPTSM